MYQISYIVVCIIYITVVMFFLVRGKIKFKTLLLSSLSGIALLFLMKAVENLTNIQIFINILSVLTALILGPIGVIFNLLVQYIIF